MMHLREDDAMLQKKKLKFEHDEEMYRHEKLKKAVVSYPPRWITIGVTSACSNKCLFCSYHSHDARHASKVYNMPYMLTLNDFKRMVDMAWAGDVPRVHICGTGEPFFNPHILEMIDYAASVYGTSSVQSNFHPKLFEKGNFLEELLKRKDKLSSITTDFLSGDPKEHERIKKGSSYYDLLDKLSYINQNSDIFLDLHFLLTHLNYHSLIPLIEDFKKYELKNCYLNVVNLFSYDMNEFTSQNAVYTSKDQEITKVLHQAVLLGKEYGISVFIPEPADSSVWDCDVFWQKVQLWPVQGNQKERYHENLIPHACRAVVLGELSSLGYLFDFETIMDFWNSERMVSIREGILSGKYPDKECQYCYLCKGFR